MKCEQCNVSEAGEGLCNENVDRSNDICLKCRQYNIYISRITNDTKLAECMAHRVESCMCVRCLG